jgi:hypothetical protein
MIPWEHTHPQAGLCATCLAEPLPKPSAGEDAALSERPWQRRAVPPAAVKTCSAVLEMRFLQVTTGSWGLDDGFPQAARASGALEMRFLQVTAGSWGLDDGFPQAARASGALEMRFLQVTAGSWGLDDGFPQAARASGALEMRFPQVTTGSWALEIEFPGGGDKLGRTEKRFSGSREATGEAAGAIFQLPG